MAGRSSFGHRAKAKIVNYQGIYASLSDEARHSFTEKANFAQEHPEKKEALKKELKKIQPITGQPLKRAKEGSVIRNLNERIRAEQNAKANQSMAQAFKNFIHELFGDKKEQKKKA